MAHSKDTITSYNAHKLDGHHATDFLMSTDVPDYSGTYAPLNHTHDYSAVYAPLNHTHDYSGVYAPLVHNHEVGTNNIKLGATALPALTTGVGNDVIGYQAGKYLTTGSYNAVLGYDALYYNVGGSQNVAVGYYAGRYAAGNVNNTAPLQSVFIGSQAMAAAADDQNEIVIGFQTTGGGSNTVAIGNSAITSVKLGGSTPVTPTEFGFLDGVTSGIQAQLDAIVGDMINPLPAGGTINQALLKNSATDYDTKWATVLLAPQGIANGSNMNSFITPGMFSCAANSTAATLINCPTTNAFSLLVEKHAGVKQTITEYLTNGTAKTWVRNNYSTTWEAWKLVQMPIVSTLDASGNVPTCAAVFSVLAGFKLYSSVTDLGLASGATLATVCENMAVKSIGVFSSDEIADTSKPIVAAMTFLVIKLSAYRTMMLAVRALCDVTTTAFAYINAWRTDTTVAVGDSWRQLTATIA
jgi:hypothetical protein